MSVLLFSGLLRIDAQHIVGVEMSESHLLLL